MAYSLPNPSKSAFCAYLVNKLGIKDFLSPPNRRADYFNMFLNAISMYSDLFELSLRKIEQCISRLAIALSLTVLNEPLYIYQLVFLIYIQAINDEIYQNIYSKKLELSDLSNFFRKFSNFNNDYLRLYFLTVEPYVAYYMFDETRFQNHIKDVNNQLINFDGDASISRIYENRKKQYENIDGNYELSCLIRLFPLINFSLDTE